MVSHYTLDSLFITWMEDLNEKMEEKWVRKIPTNLSLPCPSYLQKVIYDHDSFLQYELVFTKTL